MGGTVPPKTGLADTDLRAKTSLGDLGVVPKKGGIHAKTRNKG
jgi:hypothetical protein